MRTELSKSFQSGFKLTEQELRRLTETVGEHLRKIPELRVEAKHVVKLADGSLVETDTIEDLLQMENAGVKRIERLALEWRAADEQRPERIAVTYQDGVKSPKSWTSMEYTVVGAARDWSFVAAADIEERLRRVRTVAIGYWLNHKVLSWVLIGLFVVAANALNSAIDPSRDLGVALDSAYHAGRIANPTEALIFLEKARNEGHPGWRAMGSLFIMAVGPLLLMVLLTLGVGRLGYPYAFYWGDFVPAYDRSRSRMNVVWTVVILGLVVSIVAGILLRHI